MCLLALWHGHIRSARPLCSATFSTLRTTRSFVAGQRSALTGEVESVRHEEGISEFPVFELSRRSDVSIQRVRKKPIRVVLLY